MPTKKKRRKPQRTSAYDLQAAQLRLPRSWLGLVQEAAVNRCMSVDQFVALAAYASAIEVLGRVLPRNQERRV
jgi:uncharacterized protein (DUF1778 family)